MHGGDTKIWLENVSAVTLGGSNLARHIENVKSFSVSQYIVAINRFITDTDAEIQAVKDLASENGVKANECTRWSNGGKGTTELAEEVVK